MTVLGIDTSSILGGVALARDGRLLGEVRCDARAATSERIVPQIDRLLADLSLKKSVIERIGVTLGPGSFTGLRVGLATAKGLAAGLQVPVLGISVIEARAYALGAGSRPALIVTAPRRGEVFCGAGWRNRGGFSWLLREESRTLESAPLWTAEALQAASKLGKLPLVCAGDGVEALLHQLGSEEPQGLLALPDSVTGAVPGAVALLTAQAPETAPVSGSGLEEMVPIYLRGSYARRPGPGAKKGGD